VTCIVGIAEGGRVWMGGDSAGMIGWTRYVITRPKVVHRTGMLIGHCGTPRLLQIAETLPVAYLGGDPFRFVVDVFVPALQTAIKAADFNWLIEENDSSCLMIGLSGALFTVCNQYSVDTYADGLCTLGARDMALGALAALEDMEPEARIRQVLIICGQRGGGVAPPYYVETLTTESENG